MSVDDPSAPWHRPGSGRTQWEEMQKNPDRTVHAWGKTGEVVRYERSGKWYFEPKNYGKIRPGLAGEAVIVPKRTKLTLQEAVDKAMWLWYRDGGTVHFDRPGGAAFNRAVRARYNGN